MEIRPLNFIMFLLHFSLAHHLVEINQTAQILDIDAAQGCLYLGCEGGHCVKRKFWCADPPCPFMLYCSRDKTEKRLGPTTCQSILCSPGFQCRLKYRKSNPDSIARARCVQDTQTGVYWRFPNSFRCEPPAECPPGLECIRTGAHCKEPPCPLVQSCIKQKGFLRFQTVCNNMNCPLGTEGCFLRSADENCIPSSENNNCKPHPECLQPPELGGPLCAGQICPMGMRCSTEKDCTSSRECVTVAVCKMIPSNNDSAPLEVLDDSAILLEMLRERLSPNTDGVEIISAGSNKNEDLKYFISILQNSPLNKTMDLSSSSSEQHSVNSDESPWDIELAGRLFVVFELSANTSWTNQSYSAAWKLRELTEPSNPYRMRMRSSKNQYFLKNFLAEKEGELPQQRHPQQCPNDTTFVINGEQFSNLNLEADDRKELKEQFKQKCREIGMHDAEDIEDEKRRLLFTETDPFGNTKAADCKIILETKASDTLKANLKKSEGDLEEEDESEEDDEDDEYEDEDEDEDPINLQPSELNIQMVKLDDGNNKTNNENENNKREKQSKKLLENNNEEKNETNKKEIKANEDKKEKANKDKKEKVSTNEKIKESIQKVKDEPIQKSKREIKNNNDLVVNHILNKEN